MAVRSVADALRAGAPIDRVTFVLFTAETFDEFARALDAGR